MAQLFVAWSLRFRLVAGIPYLNGAGYVATIPCKKTGGIAWAQISLLQHVCILVTLGQELTKPIAATRCAVTALGGELREC